MQQSKTYRPDIDGLRAIAVLSVIFFHAFPALHFNGFVGVDIFFVISGFLITKNIAEEMISGKFSITNFYLRRIKRILPVFYTVTIVTLVFSVLIMLPEDLKSLGKSTFAANFSASNIYFWNSTDNNYFAKTSELFPMLHTWSLGVEEQFYFVWPIILLGILRLNQFKKSILISIVIAVLSYSFAQLALAYDASFAYYMLPARAGELLTGSAISFLAIKRKETLTGGLKFEFVAGTGLLLIFASFVVHKLGTPFPGLNALYPCAGAAMIIYAGTSRSTMVSKLLSLRPLTFVGLLSYSLYLWHWPVLALLKYLLVILTGTWLILALSITLVLSFLSWKWIETPFRKMKLEKWQVFAFYLGLPCFALGSVSIYLYETDGLLNFIATSSKYREAVAGYTENTLPAYDEQGVCQSEKFQPQKFTDSKCVIGNENENSEPKILLWGDSHASHYVGFLTSITRGRNLPFRNIELGGCPPVFTNEIEYGKTKDRASCKEFRENTHALALNYDCIIIGGMWSEYAQNPQFISDLEKTVVEFLKSGKKVVLLMQVPEFPNYARNCSVRNTRAFNIDCIGRTTYPDTGEMEVNLNIKSRIGDRKNLFYLNIRSLICATGDCSPYVNGIPIYFDRSHLSSAGSASLGVNFLKTPTSAALIAFLEKESM